MLDVPCDVRAEVSEIRLVHGIALADQLFERAADLDHVPEDQRRRQQTKVADPFLLLVRIILLNHAFNTELEPFRQRVIPSTLLVPAVTQLRSERSEIQRSR